MKRLAIILAAILALNISAYSQKISRSYVVGLYNLENLFDTYHDDGKNDYEYLPEGANQWTMAKYEKKLRNMASVIAAMAKENGQFHAVLGISEIENRHVVEDLIVQESIADANFQIVHYDGPDRRGVDVGLLYRPELFTVLESESIPFTFDKDSEIEYTLTEEEQQNFRTRDILMVRGLLAGEMFAFYVAHLPSRVGGKGQDLRPRGAEIIYRHSMKLMEKYPDIKVVVMGDMNDNPTDDSMLKFMHAVPQPEMTAPENYFSPFLPMLEAGYGSLAYRGEWSIYDLILVNHNIAKAPSGTLRILPIVKGKKKARYYGRIFVKDFMTNQEGQYKGTPFRTFSSGTFIGGYSDHYPTYIMLGK